MTILEDLESGEASVVDAAEEIERLQSIIIKAYQRLGFTGHKNETMRILGTGIPNAQNTVSTGESGDG